MKIFHTADWHLGKTLHQFSLLQDQAEAIEQMIQIILAEKPDVVLLAGDIYDRAVPPAEAVALFNRTVSRLVLDLNIPLIAIAGNHDNAERIQYGAQLFDKQGFYIAGYATYPMQPVVLNDAHGAIYFYLFPYTEPENLRFVLKNHLAEDDLAAIQTHEDVFRWVVSHIQTQRNANDRVVLVAHAFVQGGTSSDSERKLLVGGAEYISTDIFNPLTYTALGHLHNPQHFNEGKVRYSGSPFKYSISEAKQRKVIAIVEIGENSITESREIDIKTSRNLLVVQGKIEGNQFLLADNQTIVKEDDYIFVQLQNDEMQANAMAIIQKKYKNTLGLEWIALAQITGTKSLTADKIKTMSEEQLLAQFYQDLTGKPIDEVKMQIFNEVLSAARQ